KRTNQRYTSRLHQQRESSLLITGFKKGRQVCVHCEDSKGISVCVCKYVCVCVSMCVCVCVCISLPSFGYLCWPRSSHQRVASFNSHPKSEEHTFELQSHL